MILQEDELNCSLTAFILVSQWVVGDMITQHNFWWVVTASKNLMWSTQQRAAQAKKAPSFDAPQRTEWTRFGRRAQQPSWEGARKLSRIANLQRPISTDAQYPPSDQTDQSTEFVISVDQLVGWSNRTTHPCTRNIGIHRDAYAGFWRTKDVDEPRHKKPADLVNKLLANLHNGIITCN